MKAPRIAARIAGSFVLRVITLFAVILLLIVASVGVEYWISVSPGVPDQVAHYFQLAFLVVSVAIIIWASWLFGRLMAGPLATVIAWTGKLARGELEPPKDAAGRQQGRDEHGNWRPGYRTFHEVLESLDTLTEVLRETERQREAMRHMREDWIAGVSHDLKTPLAAVRGYAQLLATDEEPPEEVHRQARAILDQAQHMEQLIDDLRLTTQLRAEALPMERATVDAVELVRGAMLSVAQDPAVTGYEFALDAPDTPAQVCADSNLLGRAVRNLITNAVNHNPVGTMVTASVEPLGGSVIIVIADDGVGMDETTVSKLFDRYYRGTATNVDSGGTGLGMAIAYQLVDAHDGTLDVESKLGEGTRITMRLPAAASNTRCDEV